jgi:hypothetical protein
MPEDVLPNANTVLYVVDDHVATITLNRRDIPNVKNPETSAALSEAWMRIRDDSGVLGALEPALTPGSASRKSSAAAARTTAARNAPSASSLPPSRWNCS